jgi:hypothetical protein
VQRSDFDVALLFNGRGVIVVAEAGWCRSLKKLFLMPVRPYGSIARQRLPAKVKKAVRMDEYFSLYK